MIYWSKFYTTGDEKKCKIIIKKITRYSVQPRDWIFVKSYGLLSFAKNMVRNIGKNISKNVSGKYN